MLKLFESVNRNLFQPHYISYLFWQYARQSSIISRNYMIVDLIDIILEW